jgi:hypothetical protein
MSSESLTKPVTSDAAQWYTAVRYGVAQELRKRFEPTEGIPQRFRQLVVALQQAEQRRETDRRQLVSETAAPSEA